MAKLWLVVILFPLILSGCYKGKQGKNLNKNKMDLSADPLNAPSLQNFLFVGTIDNKAGLYKYNIKEKKYTKFWSNGSQNVVELSYSKDMKTAFFLTARHYGKRGVFPYITDVKLYLSSSDSSNVSLLKKIGSGMQVFTKWGMDNTYKVILNSFDKTIANYVHQHVQIFNMFGKELLDKTNTYNIVKDGYPKPPGIIINKVSPDKKYFLSSAGKDTISIFINNPGNGNNVFIVKGTQKLNQLRWVGEDKSVVFTTINITPNNNTLYKKKPETSKLFIYSIQSKKVIKQWNGGGVKNFFIYGKTLVFDNGFDNNSSIYIYNLNKNKMIDSVKIKGGCGLKNIPQIPDYSA